MLLINTRRVSTMAAILTLAAGIGTATTVQASPINPQFDTFGELAGTEFGGDGIPNDAVAITTIMDGENTITLGLAATERFDQPAVGNNGAGTFSATPGGFPGSMNLALWNFSFYVDIAGGGTFDDYEFDLLYDFDPGLNTDESDHGVVDAEVYASESQSPTRIENSQNLGFGYLANDAPGVIDSPTQPSFDPTATGEYTFALRAFGTDGQRANRRYG